MPIIRDEKYLLPNYYAVPENLVYPKKGTIDFFKKIFRNFLRGYTEKKIVYGPPGCGKSTLLYYLYRKYQKKLKENQIICYINCKSRRSIKSYISLLTGDLPIQPKKLPSNTEEFINFFETLPDIQIMYILDEITEDAIQVSYSVLYGLLTCDESPNIRAKISYIALTNSKKIVEYLENKKELMGRVGQRVYKPFEPYTERELKEILSRRIDYALYEDAVDDKELLIDHIIIWAHNLKEIPQPRDVIELLYNAAKIAEDKNKNKLEVEDAAEAFVLLRGKTIEEDLTPKEVLLISFLYYLVNQRIISKFESKTSIMRAYMNFLVRYIYPKEELYNTQFAIPKSTFFFLIDKLLNKKIIQVEYKTNKYGYVEEVYTLDEYLIKRQFESIKKKIDIYPYWVRRFVEIVSNL